MSTETGKHKKMYSSQWAWLNHVHMKFGHTQFMAEAKEMRKNDIFIKNVCTNQECEEA